jgi:acetyl-CoA carboxylase / biotin carboxylase 1
MTAEDDMAGISKIVQWMSYVPDKRNNPVPISPSADPWDRDVVFTPAPRQPYDVRWMIAGKQEGDEFQPGLFDKDSFVETLGGWARTVVVGRARLSGIPMGVIAVETRSIENVTPADPANPDSIEQVSQEAGGVWYPNSAFKTAQAINDFNYGEQLPLMILANWRGFSGGQRDMYNEVLKYGSFIVDALVKYEQPIFVYIPPYGELRGGSWVVVDPTINPVAMEMYADVEARGGVLEPEGIVGIKFRKDKQLQNMARNDAVYASLKKKLAEAQANNASKDEVEAIHKELTAREELLLPVYSQISLQFADLHDRSGRMKAKGVIRDQLEWTNSRRFFYWRVRRRLNEEYILRRMAAATSSVGSVTKDPVALRNHHLAKLRAWSGVPEFDTKDREVAVWYEEHRQQVNDKVAALKVETTQAHIAELLVDKTAFEGVRAALSNLPIAEKEALLKQLSS